MIFFPYSCFSVTACMVFWHPSSLSSEIPGRDKAFPTRRYFHWCWVCRRECHSFYGSTDTQWRDYVFAEVSTGRIQAMSCSFLLQSTHSATDSMISEGPLFLWSCFADTKRPAFTYSGLLLFYVLRFSSVHSLPQMQCSEQSLLCDQLGSWRCSSVAVCEWHGAFAQLT